VIAEEGQESREAKLAKLKQLQELQAQLDSIESEAPTSENQSQSEPKPEMDELDNLESTIAAGIKSTTKGETLLEVSISDQEIDREMAALEKELAAEAKVIVLTAYEKLIAIHDWLDAPQYGFMYSIPNSKKARDDFESWQEEWSQVLLDYAHVGLLHILYPRRMLTEKPFNKFTNRKKAIEIIAQVLVEKDLAEWTGDKPKKKEALRVYWKTIEEWVVIIEDWAQANALFEIVMLPDIRNAETEFANLPEEDLRRIFKKIQQNQNGTMVELDNNQFGIKFRLI
ncbi:MAG: hypothetical protein KAR20_10500, partial [Candidatus Heimdallarchaeota archaeon]|nr:hypothetical protein [Candidatus Heimdallarchaeota archaeon]